MTDMARAYAIVLVVILGFGILSGVCIFLADRHHHKKKRKHEGHHHRLFE